MCRTKALVIQKLTCLHICRGCSMYQIRKEELTARRNICKSSKFALRRDISNFLNAIAQTKCNEDIWLHAKYIQDHKIKIS